MNIDFESALERAEARGLRARVHSSGCVLIGTPPGAAPSTASMSAPRERALLLRQAGAETLQLMAPVTLGVDAGLPAAFSGIAYSGGYVPDYEVVIDMATTTYKPRMPLLNAHQRSEIIGVVEQAATRDGQMHVAGRLFSDMPDSAAQRIGQLAQRGAPYEMSVGLYAFTREAVPAGKSISVNGRTISGPVNVLRHGQVREVSLVTLGADPNTYSRIT